MTVLDTASAMETNVLDTMKMAEDAVLHLTRTMVHGLEPVTKRMPERPVNSLWPAPDEVVDHSFEFVDKVVANLRAFSKEFVELLPVKVEPHPRAVKASPKAQAA